MPTYTGRVSYRGNASLAVHGLTFEDSGNYSVQVSAHHTGGTFDTIHHTLHVTVAGESWKGKSEERRERVGEGRERGERRERGREREGEEREGVMGERERERQGRGREGEREGVRSERGGERERMRRERGEGG